MKTFRHTVLQERTLGGGYRAIQEEPLSIHDLLNSALCLFPNSHNQSIQQCIRIFFCYRNPSSADILCMAIILEAILQGMIKYEIEFISTAPCIAAFNESSVREGKRVVESAEHLGMKEWVRNHLINKGIPVARDEVSMLGYEIDVGCFKENVFVECGDTETRKVFELLRNGNCVGIFQYNTEEILWFKPDNRFHDFANEKVYGVLA
jgi:hypothetical protein